VASFFCPSHPVPLQPVYNPDINTDLLSVVSSYQPGTWLDLGQEGPVMEAPFDEVKEPSRVVLLADKDQATAEWRGPWWGEDVRSKKGRLHTLYRHSNGRTPLLLYDLHVESRRFEQTFRPVFRWWERTDTDAKRALMAETLKLGLLTKAEAPPE
jgi:hypothetical protein